MDKQKYLDIAEIINAFRIIPRMLLVAMGFLIWAVVQWFMGVDDPSTQQTTLVTTITAIIPAIIGLYQSTGNK